MEETLSLPKKLLLLVKSYPLISGVFLVGMICLVIGLIQYFSPKSEQITFEASKDVKSAETENISIFVDISGEVKNPDLYEFNSQARVKDAIDKAGGLTQNADSEYVSKSINLAAKLTDGMKIYIPKVGEELGSLNFNSNTSINSQIQNTQISINNASSSELESLPGVGVVTAQKIISNRPYSDIQDLVSKKAIGSNLYSKIKDQISL